TAFCGNRIMAKRNVIIFLIFVSSCLLFSPAQMLLAANTGNSDTPLTLGEAITMGLANNPMITAVQSQVDASKARVSQARSGFFPQVDLSQSFNRTTNPMWAFGTKLNQEVITSEDFDPERLNDPDAIDNFATTVSVSLPVYDRGENWIGLNQAKLDHEAFSLSADRIRQQVIVNIVISYSDALLSHENLLVVVQTLETAEAHLKMVRSRFKSGLVVKSDLLRAEVRIAELEQERLQAQSQVDVANSMLNAAMGVEIDRSFQLQTPLERMSEKPDCLGTWISTSLENRPDLEQIRLQEIIAQKEVKKAKAAHLPGLYLLGSYEINSEDFSETGNNYTVGAIMRFNLFSGFGKQSKVKEAMADVRRTQAMARRLELGIKVETRQAFFQAQSAYGCIGVAKAAVAQADEGLRIVRNRYENGLFTIVNLLDAEVALQQTRNNYLRSLHNFKVAMARLNLAAGTVDETFVTTQVVR
ncbi:MAG: TolC family protein, partial [Deltaproteobacteria bacterium]|nr:TolC family protein [Deltaproteobacteria bacterium]